MSTTEILFWFLSALALVGATMVLINRNPIHSILWLIVVFFAISGHYILLNAQFLATVSFCGNVNEPEQRYRTTKE